MSDDEPYSEWYWTWIDTWPMRPFRALFQRLRHEPLAPLILWGAFLLARLAFH